MQINYEIPGLASVATDNSIITTSETDIMVVTDGKFIRQTQLSIYLKVTLGSATGLKIRYYMSPDNGTTWFQIPIKDKITGVLYDTPSIISSDSPTQSSAQLIVEDVPLSGGTAYKVTAQSVGSSSTLNKGYIFIRDN